MNCIRNLSAFFDCFEIDCKPVVDKIAIGDFPTIDVDNFLCYVFYYYLYLF